MPECCSIPNILANTDKAWDTCIEKRNNTMDKPHPLPPDHKENGKGHGPPCLFQCVFINSGLADQDGKLDEQKVSSKISEVLKGDPKWGSFEWQQSLNKCFSEIKNLKEEQNNHMMDTPSGRLMKCFLRDLYLNCPYNAWVESSECTSQKSLVQNCPMLPPPVLKHGPPKKN
uniref:Odorant binding protein 6 n=1 Tax=Daktulosphaira vitifoliae TaxID=58002 RepID=A0A1W6R6E4_DAKVI|nr:odorant binding protein 6 [Daktulosphaira vitifoliae]